MEIGSNYQRSYINEDNRDFISRKISHFMQKNGLGISVGLLYNNKSNHAK